VHRKANDHDIMKREMAKAMKSAQQDSALRVVYGDREAYAFPDWLKSEAM
jgi:hypothetical protein